MKRQGSKPPEHRDVQADFFGDVGPNDGAGLDERLLALSALLPARSPGTRRGTLASAISELPLRYAPFFQRLSGLWQISEDAVERELQRAKKPSSWTLTLLRGVNTSEVGAQPRVGPVLAAAVLRGRLSLSEASSPRHRACARARRQLRRFHSCRAGAGEEQLMQAGSEHELRVLGNHDCIAAVAEHGMGFTGPWLHWASKLFG